MCGSFLLNFFYLGGYLVCLLSLAPCLVAARAVRWRPRLAGTQQYVILDTSRKCITLKNLLLQICLTWVPFWAIMPVLLFQQQESIAK